jgi:predicted PurR-regulated permease PerM
LSFFFLKDGHTIYRFIYEITPLDEVHKKKIFHGIKETFQAVIQGQIFTAFVQAGLAGLIFTCLGLPLPILFASLTFLFSMVPITGAATVWLPFVIYLLITSHMTKAVILLILGFFGISMVDNFLKPILIGEKTKLPYMLLFLGILGGLRVYGLMGVFLVPTLLSLMMVLLQIYRERFAA